MMSSLDKTNEVDSVILRQGLSQKPCLMCLTGHQAGLLLQLDSEQSPYVIGRSEEADLQIDTPEISREHARLVFKDRHSLMLEDLNSTNGSFVNNKKISREFLFANDKIQLGPHTLLKFLYQDEEEIQHYISLYERSIRDALTGVFNRRHFDESLEREWSFSRRHELPLSVLLLDLDRFKQVNDTHGHGVGDEVLKEFARRVQGQIRKEDLLARYGGEEFVILLRHTNAIGSRVISERIRECIYQTPFPTAQGELPVTVSMGFATFESEDFAGQTPDDLVQQADAYLYDAKESGRNCVCGPPSQEST